MEWLVSELQIFCADNMYHLIYRLPIWLVIYAMFVATLIYAVITYILYNGKEAVNEKYLKHWKIFNYILFVLSVYAIFHLTVISRKPGKDILVLMPFHSIAVTKYQPEMWRSLLMNIALFFPFGVSLSSILHDKHSARKNILCTSAAGLLLSLLIESIQYFYSLGEAWTDDVICNTLGAFLGVTYILFLKFYNFLKSKQKNEL